MPAPSLSHEVLKRKEMNKQPPGAWRQQTGFKMLVGCYFLLFYFVFFPRGGRTSPLQSSWDWAATPPPWLLATLGHGHTVMGFHKKGFMQICMSTQRVFMSILVWGDMSSD